MVHNGIEYGLMQAYAEGFELMNASQFDLDFEQISGIWRYGSVVRSWLIELLHDAIAEHGNDFAEIAGYVEDSGEGRWTVKEAVDYAVPAAGDHGGPLRPLRVPPGRVVRSEDQRRPPSTVRRPRGKEEAMTETQTPPQENPLLEGLGPRRTPEPCVLVIFGASGDLTRRKIFPALYALAYRRLLPERFAVVGTARSEWTDDEFRDRMEHAVREFGRDDFKQDVWDWLAGATQYLAMDFADESKADELVSLLNRLDEERGTAETASTTSPSPRRRCRPSSRAWASGAGRKAGRGSSSRSRSGTTSPRPAS